MYKNKYGGRVLPSYGADVIWNQIIVTLSKQPTKI